MIPIKNIPRFFFKAIRQPVYAFTVLKKRLLASAYYKWGHGRSYFPEAVTLFLTHRCNLRCKMCGQWGEGGVTKVQGAGFVQSELSLEELKKIIDELAIHRTSVTLFGGEPLLYGRYLDLVRYIKLRKIHCLTITNGSLLEKIYGELVDAGLDELNVSLDGKAQLHDEIRGMKGLYDQIMRGLKGVARAKREKGLRAPLINIQCTINKYNYTHLDEMVDVALECGAASLTFHNLIFTSPEVLSRQEECDRILKSSSENWQGFVFDPGIDPLVLKEKLASLTAKRYPFALDVYPNFSKDALVAYYRDCAGIPSGYASRCLSPWICAYIFPDGEVRPCLNSSYSFGTIKNTSLSSAWNSEKALSYRNFLKTRHIFPACARCTELYRY